jgi:VIT1/CCC1 family predicted Fe2+/Mn2+ transporter
LLRELKATADPHAARGMIAEVLPDRIAEVLAPDEIDSMKRRLVALPDPPKGLLVHREDLLAATAVCLLVFLSTFPLTIPFMIVHNARLALRISNAIALVMLFLLGHSLGRYAGGHPWRLGFGMLVLGGVLVAIVIALGG